MADTMDTENGTSILDDGPVKTAKQQAKVNFKIYQNFLPKTCLSTVLVWHGNGFPWLCCRKVFVLKH